ncbi:MAG: Ribose import binding protein RbsB [Pseudomonas citronellolis]|nr:MAG: Ribose import binding protein RbsB [Pseudomonas citronellolis]
MKSLICKCLLLLALGLPAFAQAASVVFINPGRTNESFWTSYTAFMQAAARDLGMSLDVRYAERDPQRALALARQVLAEPRQPDFLVFVNESYIGPELLRLFADSPVKLFAVNSTLTPDQQRIAGTSRGRHRNWIGSLVADEEQGGYLMASALLQRFRQERHIDLIALSGVRQTPAVQFREQGLRRALADYPQAHLLQVVDAGWSRDRAYEQARQLLERHPQTRAVWAASDDIAFGAMQAAAELGRTPGQDLLFSGINNSPAFLEAIKDGRISAGVAGHFTLGAWALVLLHDYAAGVDFAEHGGKDRQVPLFALLDSRSAGNLQRNLQKPGFGLDFRRYSLALNPQLKQYAFSLQPLLQ